jgi:hypothetical protein
MSSPDLVVVRTFPSRIEAEIAQSALEADGIQAVVLADDAGGQYSSLWMNGVRLLVPTGQAIRAVEILDAPPVEDRDSSDDRRGVVLPFEDRGSLSESADDERDDE